MPAAAEGGAAEEAEVPPRDEIAPCWEGETPLGDGVAALWEEAALPKELAGADGEADATLLEEEAKSPGDGVRPLWLPKPIMEAFVPLWDMPLGEVPTGEVPPENAALGELLVLF